MEKLTSEELGYIKRMLEMELEITNDDLQYALDEGLSTDNYFQKIEILEGILEKISQ